MTLRDEWRVRVESELCRISTSLPAVEWYLFGSFAANHAASSDIDVLAVHPRSVDSRLVRAESACLCTDLPVHLLIMTDDEERELNFVASQRCVRVLHA